jgi:hypothetical protein
VNAHVVEPRCACCGAELPHGDRGRRFCGSACRQAAYRRRCAGRTEARPCCAHCHAPLDPRPGSGSPRRFCAGRCRQAAWRRRRAGVPESTAGLEPDGRRRLVHRAHAERWSRMGDVERLLEAIAPVDVEDLVAELLASLDDAEA